MNIKQETDERIEYTGNDELYPTEIIFTNGLKVRLVCSEDGQKYLRVEPS